jgi:hypothetical protein
MGHLADPATRPFTVVWHRWAGHEAPNIIAMAGFYSVLLIAFYVDNAKKLRLWDRLPICGLRWWRLCSVVALRDRGS